MRKRDRERDRKKHRERERERRKKQRERRVRRKEKERLFVCQQIFRLKGKQIIQFKFAFRFCCLLSLIGCNFSFWPDAKTA